MSTIDERLRGLDIALPDVMPPVVDGYVPAFAPFVRSGDQIHLSGRLGKKDGKPLFGKVGEEISLEQGKVAARGVAIELLAVLKAAAGDLDNVRRIVKLLVMVNGAPNFTEPHRVADGASELLVQVFGERGIHARSAVSGQSRGMQNAGISGRMPLWRSRNHLSHRHRSHVLAAAARRLFVLSAPWRGWDIGPGGHSFRQHRGSLQGSVLSFRASDRGFLDLR